MSVFGDTYSRYYDLIYKNKDYAGEAIYFDELIQRFHPGSKRLLELGCGTGKHAGLFVEKGYLVCGIDQSEAMLNIARKQEMGEQLSFIQGDIRSVSLSRSFDAVIALFHVMNYLNSNEDLLNTFANAGKHLEAGGIFLFDCWYGPAVLSDRPNVRIKRFADDRLDMVRLAEPEMIADENIVNVNYHVFVRDKENGERDELKESHRMRYLFTPEIELMFAHGGMSIEACFEFISGKQPGYDTWNVVYVGRKL